jgi:hypothetical protein
MNTAEQKEFLQATAWLRPVTRWAAAFSFKTSAYLPAVVRNLPLKLVKRILAGYQKRAGSGCKTR